jgi:hypothetical protein
MIAALYVETDGCYFGLPDVDPWDEQRDARLYGGPWPVVAHSPCERWGRGSGSRSDSASARHSQDQRRRWRLLQVGQGCRPQRGAACASIRGDLMALAHFGLTDSAADWRLGAGGRFGGGWTAAWSRAATATTLASPLWLYVKGPMLSGAGLGAGESASGSCSDKAHGATESAKETRRRSQGRAAGTRQAKRIGTQPPFRDLLLEIAQCPNPRTALGIVGSPDFESQSACDLKAAGAYRYAVDPTTHALLLLHLRRRPGNPVVAGPAAPAAGADCDREGRDVRLP